MSKWTKDELLRNLKRVQKKYEHKSTLTFDVNIYEMVTDVIDFLENEHFDNNMARTCQNLVSEIDKLEKALDKTIDEYADLHDSLVANGSDDFPYFNKEEYKEYLLNEI